MMRTEITFLKRHWGELTTYFSLESENESGAVALAKLVRNDQVLRFLVRDIVIPKEEEYLEKTPVSISFTADFMERNFQRCEREKMHLVNIHNHPFSKVGSFSPIDDTEDKKTKGPYVEKWVPGTEQAFMVMGNNPEKLDARFWSLESRRLSPIDLVKVM